MSSENALQLASHTALETNPRLAPHPAPEAVQPFALGTASVPGHTSGPALAVPGPWQHSLSAFACALMLAAGCSPGTAPPSSSRTRAPSAPVQDASATPTPSAPVPTASAPSSAPHPAPSPLPTSVARHSSLPERQIQAAAAYSEAFAGRAFLVLQDGRVIAERYAGGWGAARPHALASGTKSFTGIVAAAALADGVITSLDERVAETLTEWQADPRKSTITVRELLTLSSGLEPGSELLGRQGAGIRDLGGVSDLAGRMRGGNKERMPPDRFAAVLGVPAVAAPGTEFAYGPTHFYAFGAFLERKLQASNRPERTFWEYLAARVLTPAGIEIGLERFAPDQGGKPNLPGGGHLAAREWARFGEFVRCGGRTLERGDDGALRPTGPQAIPSELIAACFVPSAANPRYGLTWWLLNGAPGEGARLRTSGEIGRGARGATAEAAQLGTVRTVDGTPLQIVMAAGAGKQRLYIVPEFGLVVVRFAELGPKGARFNDMAFLRALLGLAAEDAKATGGATASPTPGAPPESADDPISDEP